VGITGCCAEAAAAGAEAAEAEGGWIAVTRMSDYLRN